MGAVIRLSYNYNVSDGLNIVERSGTVEGSKIRATVLCRSDEVCYSKTPD